MLPNTPYNIRSNTNIQRTITFIRKYINVIFFHFITQVACIFFWIPRSSRGMTMGGPIYAGMTYGIVYGSSQ
ncbi:MAG: hypothetical protein ACEY3D_02315 [Rickettsia sp.]|uniref:hypothetical protein n=1 Tax=Rickettsia sp. TaxID=789 RepID=UPI00397C6ED3